jgi:hypothetical protein
MLPIDPAAKARRSEMRRAGHHRIAAAIAAGIKTGDVVVSKMDDGGMIRMYAQENATHRANAGTAQVGTIASAVRFLARGILTGDGATDKFISSGDIDVETCRQRLTDSRGLGRDVIVQFLRGVPGINDGTVQQQLANLKASGNKSAGVGSGDRKAVPGSP